MLKNPAVYKLKKRKALNGKAKLSNLKNINKKIISLSDLTKRNDKADISLSDEGVFISIDLGEDNKSTMKKSTTCSIYFPLLGRNEEEYPVFNFEIRKVLYSNKKGKEAAVEDSLLIYKSFKEDIKEICNEDPFLVDLKFIKTETVKLSIEEDTYITTFLAALQENITNKELSYLISDVKINELKTIFKKEGLTPLSNDTSFIEYLLRFEKLTNLMLEDPEDFKMFIKSLTDLKKEDCLSLIQLNFAE